MQVSTQMGPFSIVPEWVLERGLSPTALKLYIVLARYADWETGIAFPARDTLAERMKSSEKTVDRAVKELVAAECIGKEYRGRYTSARYRVFQIDPRETDLSVEQTEVSREGTNLSARLDKNVHITITNELEPLEREPKNERAREIRATRLPEDWYPSERLLEMFATKWPNLDQQFEIEDFLLYWHSVPTKKTDWDRTFQRWMNEHQQKAVKQRLVRGERLTNNKKAALLAQKYRAEAQAQRELEAVENPQQVKELEAEVSTWLKGVDDV